MADYQEELAFETKYLAEIIAIAQAQLAAIRQSNGQNLAELVQAKKDLWENSSHAITNLWSGDSFYELAARSQYTNQVANKASLLEMEANKLLSLERMVRAPYFARIDFSFAQGGNTEKIYIGRAGLMEGLQLYVYDWRSPIASVFYRFGLGEAYYDAPQGRISGQVGLKRQYEIANGALAYFFDADLQIMDEFLRKLLAQNASAKMKTIVETIQKDQDIIIRDLENDLLLVQGAAGSGKTAVALHRVAYLMYQGLKQRLAAQNILILSPTALFAQYISNVLPELGEDAAVTVTFDSVLAKLLPGRPIQSRNQQLEALLTNDDQDQARLLKSSLAFKASGQFKEILDRFCQDIPRKWLPFSDLDYDGQCISRRALLQAEVLARKTQPLALRLNRLEASVWEKVHARRPSRLKKLQAFAAQLEGHGLEAEALARLLSIAESAALRRQIHSFTRLDLLSLYKKLFGSLSYFQGLAQGIPLPPEIGDILKLTRDNLADSQLPYADGLALAYLHLKVYGPQPDLTIKQAVIDEAQDYYPLHFEILRLLFPKARYTILGDVQQTIEKAADLSLFLEIEKILAKEKAALITMNKSFRCTREILDFSRQFLPPAAEIESFSRQGAAPKIYSAPDQEGLDALIIQEIRSCQALGCQSIGLLCKTEQDARALAGRLQQRVDLSFIGSGTVTAIQGVFCLPIYMAKGLEFDAALLYRTDKGRYSTEADQKLLYIGCTRALHRLSLFYTGEISPLIRQTGGEN